MIRLLFTVWLILTGGPPEELAGVGLMEENPHSADLIDQELRGDFLMDQDSDNTGLMELDPDGVESISNETVLEAEVISPEMMTGESRVIYIQDRWRFQAGDNMEWATPAYDDSGWELISTNLTQADLSFIEWDGIGWFRKEFRVSPELQGKPLALVIDRHLGASEVFLNGEKIYELGSFSTRPEEVEFYSRNNPLVLIFPEQERHVMAVRFINPDYLETGKLTGYNGFRFLLGDWATYQSSRFSFISQWTSRNMFYIGILLAFAVIHMLLFLFYRVEKRNLYFSIFVTFLAVMSYLIYQAEINDFTYEAVFLFRFTLVTEIILLAFAARFTHSIDKSATPVYANALVVIAFIAALLIWQFPIELSWLREVIVIAFFLEILRTLGVMFYRRRSGVWVLGAGVLAFLFGLGYSSMVSFDMISGSVQTGNMVGSGLLIFSMSIFLSREFALTQRSLEQKLEEVQELSKKTIEQERINKEKELEKKLLQAENERKTKELEEARRLQLSMLPNQMPEVPEYDMAVFMRTATEVGGDYYDYSLKKDGSVVLALGDATGHGMKAGIMVAAAKSYFHTLVQEHDNLNVLNKMSSGLRNMNMRMMYMGLMLARCNGSELEIATAGMPPALHYMKSEDRVSRIELKGLPLGSQVDYPYQNETVRVEPGDVVLLLSDGLTELFNSSREMLGLRRVEETLRASADRSANDIVNQLTRLAESWSGSSEPEDDITLLAIKVRQEG